VILLQADNHALPHSIQATNQPMLLSGFAGKQVSVCKQDIGSGGGIRTPDTRIMIPLL
jgi:hypothetical protein